MISRLAVSNYRGIKRGEVDGLAQVNIFIGKNNSGKSSILEAIYLLSSAVHLTDPLNRDRLQHLIARRSAGGREKGEEVLWHSYDTSQPIEVHVNTPLGPLKAELHQWHPHPLVKAEGGIAIGTEKYDLLCLIDKIAIRGPGWGGPAVADPGYVMSWIRDREGLAHFLRGIVLLEPGPISSAVLEPLWPALLRRRLDRLLVEMLREAYDVDVEDLTYVPYAGRYQLVAKLPHTFVRLDDLGDGARYAAVLTAVASLTEGSALLIEEPEASQHPYGLLRLTDILLGLARRGGTQVFITTHSLELLKAVRQANEEHGLSAAVFFVERDGEGALSARRLTLDEEDRLRKLGIDARFLYMF